MSNDKTLATAKHGGCVQLGDWLLPCPFCGNGAEFVPYKNNGLTLKCKSMGCIQRHQRTLRYGIEWLRTSMTEHWNTRTFAAPPSPADALPDIESWSKGYDSGYARAVADFAASQPVGIGADWVLGYLTTDAPEESRQAIRNAFAEYAALSGARQPVGEPVCSGGFVISNGSGEKYMAWGQVGPEWTADRSAALWLVRRADAEALAAENEDAWSILSVERCALPPRGWACTLADGHEGPCPTIAAPPVQSAGEPMEMRICELRHVSLKPNRPYVFTIDANCANCRADAAYAMGHTDTKPAQAVDLPYSLDADPAGIRARVADVITGTLMVGAQGHMPPPAGHWAEPFWQAARADAKAQAVALAQMPHGIRLIEIPRRNNLDPINVFVQDYELGRGRIVVTCYGQAWCGFWGAMGDRTVMQFVAACDADYVAGNMLSGRHGHVRKHERAYVERIATEVITEFHALLDSQAAGNGQPELPA